MSRAAGGNDVFVHVSDLARSKLPSLSKWQRVISTPFLVLPDKLAQARPDKRATFYNSQVSTQIIGEMLIHVIRAPHPRLARMWRFHLPQRQGIFRIWPVSEYGVTWPLATINDTSASYIADAYKEFHHRR
jgi:hypothetical protein